MKRLLSIFCSGLLLLVSGCQKDPENAAEERTGPGETSDGGLLSRVVFQHSETDSSYTDLWYDAAGNWAGSKANNDAPVLNDYVQTRVYRTASGTAYRYVTFDDADPNADSLVYRLQYDHAKKQYAAKVKLDSRTGEARDSTVYDYENNHVIAAHLFMRSATTGLYAEQARAAFSYNNSGNLATMNSFRLSSQADNNFVPVSETNFIYDDKINPLNLGIEALVLDQVFFVSPNNIIRILIRNAANNYAQHEILDFTYRYHASEKPRSAELKSGMAPVPMYFRYK